MFDPFARRVAAVAELLRWRNESFFGGGEIERRFIGDSIC
jgi:hypothetical protein